MGWDAYAEGLYKGWIERDRGRWHWFRNNGGIEIYSRLTDKEAVRRHIARLCLVTPEQVVFKKQKEV